MITTSLWMRMAIVMGGVVLFSCGNVSGQGLSRESDGSAPSTLSSGHAIPQETNPTTTTGPAIQQTEARCQALKATIVGTEGDDEITGTSGEDIIAALGGDDTIDGRDGFDRICGGPGNDDVTDLDDSHINGGSGDDTVVAGGPGGPGFGPDINAGAGNDHITVTEDSTNSNISPGAGNDVIEARSSADILVFDKGPTGINVDLLKGTARGQGNDSFVGIEHVVGSRQDDVILGDHSRHGHPGFFDEVPHVTAFTGNWLRGLGGDDVIKGRRGSDFVDGGRGNDRLRDGRGAMDIVGYEHQDGSDQVANLLRGRATGFEGNDTLHGFEGIHGGGRQIGDGGDNYLSGGWGRDVLKGRKGDDLLFPGVGNDLIRGGRGSDTIGGTGMTAGGGNDEIHAGPGWDIISDALRGHDEIFGGRGRDLFAISELYGGHREGIFVDLSDGIIFGTDDCTRRNLSQCGDLYEIHAIESVQGSHRGDRIRGDGGRNVLRGMDGDDKIWGRRGNDRLDGGDGTDRLDGGPGRDSCLRGENLSRCE